MARASMIYCEQSPPLPPAVACSLGSRVGCSRFCPLPSTAMTPKLRKSARTTRKRGSAPHHRHYHSRHYHSRHYHPHRPRCSHPHRMAAPADRSPVTEAVSRAASAVTTPTARFLARYARPRGSAPARRLYLTSAAGLVSRHVCLPRSTRATQTPAAAAFVTCGRATASLVPVARNTKSWSPAAPGSVGGETRGSPARSTPSAPAKTASAVPLAAAANDRRPRSHTAQSGQGHPLRS
jgi:hypothetical protein